MTRRTEEDRYKDFAKANASRIEERTLDRYWRYVLKYKEITDGKVDEIAVGRFKRWAEEVVTKRSGRREARYKVNSRLVIYAAINHYLALREAKTSGGKDLRIRLPTKEPLTDEEAPCPETDAVLRIVATAETVTTVPKGWQIADPGTFYAALVRLIRDVGWSNVDIARAIPAWLREDERAGPVLDPARRQKTGAEMTGLLQRETWEWIHRHLAANRPVTHIFEIHPGERMSQQQIARAWREVTRAAGGPSWDWITPRTIRRFAQTEFDGDPKDYMVQFGLKDPKTSVRSYKKKRLARMRATMDRRRQSYAPPPAATTPGAEEMRRQLLARFAAGLISAEAYELALRELGVLRGGQEDAKDRDDLGYVR